MSLATIKVTNLHGDEQTVLAHAAADFIKANPAWRIAANDAPAADLPAMVHPQAYSAMKKERDGWQEEAGRLRDERDTMRRTLDLRTLHQARDVWFWQDDGEDHPESMCNSMAVVIRADVLRALMNGASLSADDRAILEAVRREIPSRERKGGNAPGHSHSKPGVWDSDNGPIAGTACAWCATWAKFTRLIEGGAA